MSSLPGNASGRHRRPFVPCALLAIVAVISAACSRTSDPHNTLAALHVSRNVLVDSRNHRVVLRGVTVYAMPFEDLGDGRPDPNLLRTTRLASAGRTTLFASIAAAGANVVRIPVSSYSYNHDSYGLGGQAAYVRRLTEIVAAARSAGLYVIIGWWDSLDWGSSLPADEPGQAPMMRVVERAFAHTGSVMFEPLNEPNGVTWRQWQPVVTSLLSLWRTDLRYDGVLILDTIDFSWDFDPGQARTVLNEDAAARGGAPDVLFANHRYANAATCFCGATATEWHNDIEANVPSFPILGDEYGNFNAPYPPQPLWTAQFLQAANAAIPKGLNGALAFVWYWIDPNSITGPNAVGLTPYGRQVETYLLRPSQ